MRTGCLTADKPSRIQGGGGYALPLKGCGKQPAEERRDGGEQSPQAGESADAERSIMPGENAQHQNLCSKRGGKGP